MAIIAILRLWFQLTARKPPNNTKGKRRNLSHLIPNSEIRYNLKVLVEALKESLKSHSFMADMTEDETKA